ncbi:MAG: hypothetical protein SFU98_20790 [Leptospiraceae bacterium]|nr:hypothetical protein [Leptospiraceae bacterium]
MIPTLTSDNQSLANHDQKIFAIEKFMQENPFYELQDLYRWLYYGEFGYQEQVSYLRREKLKPELIKILDEYKSEKDNPDISQRVWEPMGLSQRFVMVFITAYYNQKCPLKRIVNLLERSPAFRGTRMKFKLDWAFVKDYAIRKTGRFTKQDFYGFEDRINFHQLPEVTFTSKFLDAKPEKYRILPRKLFFEFFPEFDTREDILFTRAKDSLID